MFGGQEMSTKIAFIAENQFKDVELQLKYTDILKEYSKADLISELWVDL